MSLRTPLSRVRGLGAAKSGTGHFWAQRVSAVALIPLTLWLLAAVVATVGQPHAEVAAFLAHPVNAIAMLVFVLTGLWHMKLGIQVVIEDYLDGAARLTLVIANIFFAGGVAAACVFAIFRLAL